MNRRQFTLTTLIGLLCPWKRAAAQFKAIPFYERHTDCILFYAEDTPSWADYDYSGSSDLIIFRADDDNRAIGFEVQFATKHVRKIAASGLRPILGVLACSAFGGWIHPDFRNDWWAIRYQFQPSSEIGRNR